MTKLIKKEDPEKTLAGVDREAVSQVLDILPDNMKIRPFGYWSTICFKLSVQPKILPNFSLKKEMKG